MMSEILTLIDSTWVPKKMDEQNGNCLWLERNIDLRVVYVSPTIKRIEQTQWINMMVRTVERSYGEFCKTIFGDNGNLLPTMFTKSLISERHPVEIEKYIFNGMLDEAAAWASSMDFVARMKAYADKRPDMPPMDQVWHVAALAYYEKYEQLMSYQEMFSKGNRLNFLPIVTDEMLDRAVDCAVRNLGS